MENSFSKILDSDEQIVEIFKPNKFRAVWLSVLRLALTFLPFIVFIVFFTIMFSFGLSAAGDVGSGITGFLVIGIFSLVIIGSIISSLVKIILGYKNTFYCYTSKRIIIQSGIIGIDYKTLDYDAIGGMDVRVDFLDKIGKRETGTIIFITAASPISHGGTLYYFAHIEKPYEVYKRVKEYSTLNRDGKLNS